MASEIDMQREGCSRTETRSTIERFFAGFLQESSIKWILLVGVAIVTGCSLMLVTQRWSGWPASGKYLTILTYTIGAYLVAELCTWRLGLRATSQVLKLLTIALIPIGFLALAAFSPATASTDVLGTSVKMLLMVPATGFMIYAADRIFRDWLHRRQLTFLVAYCLLCLAGALPVIHQTWLAVLFSCGFWLVMSLGVLKVTRHQFWLTEEHRWPRVWGFTPIAILGTQLIVLLATKTLSTLPIHWLGFGMVMLAATVLLTTRTIAQVFRQRTGNLVRPLPMSLMVPLVVGVTLISVGVCLSFHGFSFNAHATRAVVPTAIVSAALLLCVARDTRCSAFTWFGLVLITIAYQSSPLLFGELINNIKSAAASSINEPRLPFAFYGVTYLPLLMTFAIAARWLHGRHCVEFTSPLKHWTACLSVLLMLIALTNLKATFVVSGLSTMGFVAYAILFRERLFLLPAVVCSTLFAITVIPFVNTMQWVHCDHRWTLAVVSALGLVFSISNVWDRLAVRLPSSLDGFFGRLNRGSIATSQLHPLSIQCFGHVVVVIATGLWFVVYGLNDAYWLNALSVSAKEATFVVILLSPILWTLRSQHYLSGLWMWSIVFAGSWLSLVSLVRDQEVARSLFVVAAGVITITLRVLLDRLSVDYSLYRLGRNDLKRALQLENRTEAFLIPLLHAACASFIVLVLGIWLPALVSATATLDSTVLPLGWQGVIACLLLAAIFFRDRLVAAGSLLILPIAGGVLVGESWPMLFSYENLPPIYAIIVCLLNVRFNRSRVNQDASTKLICVGWFSGLVSFGFVWLTPQTFIAALIALFGIYIVEQPRLTSKVSTRIGILGTSLLIVALAMLSGYRGFIGWLPLSSYALNASALMSLGMIAALVVFDRPGEWYRFDAATLANWKTGLRVAAALFGTVSLLANHLPIWLEASLLIAFALAATNEFAAAVRTQNKSFVYTGLAVTAVIILRMHFDHALPISDTLVRLILIVGSVTAFLLARLWKGHVSKQIVVPELHLTGIALPFIVAAGSLLGSAHGAAETFTVFAAATILFMRGLTQRLPWLILAAAAIFNLGLCTLWSSLLLSDPQYYLIPIGLTVIGLVQLLRRDIPSKAHDPLRYGGALTILVSPCFEILGGSWLHMLSLMVIAVLVILLAIGLRVRAFMVTGTAFLLLDLGAMIVRSTIDRPGMLWVTGLLVGAIVIAIAAICERHRERLLSQVRLLSAELATWH